jgi:5-methylthioribose kinase
LDAQTRLTDELLPRYLEGIGLLSPQEKVSVEPAGDGNINWVRRVRCRSDGRSFVVKQARPSLERFPEYQVPTERIVFEARYYEKARRLQPSPICPGVLRFDERERVLILEDLGAAERLDRCLARGGGGVEPAHALGAFLGAIHVGTCDTGLVDEFRNDAMRRLHGDHIFYLPLRPNEFPLSAALRRRAEALWGDAELLARADAAYARYLDPQGALVHGDVQAGNVILTETAPKLLDAEIAHVGDPAFDLGTLIAHLLIPALGRGAPAEGVAASVSAWTGYREAPHSSPPPFTTAARYAGLEMLRRTIGAARVPAVEADEAGLAVLEAALRLIRRPPDHPEALLS